MTAKQIAPSLATEGDSKSSTGGLNNFILQPIRGRIRFSKPVDDYLSRLAVRIELGTVQAWQLPDSVAQMYWLAWHAGRDSRKAEVDHLERTADRLYAELCRRPGVPFIDPNRPSYADLERIRGNHEHADEIEAQNRARFEEVTQ